MPAAPEPPPDTVLLDTVLRRWATAPPRRTPARGGGCRILAVDGPSGAGKTTLARRLADRLHAPVVHVEDLYPGWDGLEAATAALVGWVLAPLAVGGTARIRRYDWPTGLLQDWAAVPAAPVLVLEGVGAGARACAPYLSLLVWLDAPAAVRRTRALARDGERYRPHWAAWAAAERRHFEREATAARADLRLTS